MTVSILRLAALAAMASAPVLAQTDFPEVEPNGTKGESTLASCMVANDTLSGLTTGSDVTAGNTADATADTFRVKTCALPLGIHRHELLILTGGTVGHTATIRGSSQSGPPCGGGTIGTGDISTQSSSTSTVPSRMNRWYGFGRGEELHYRITGTPSTSASYSSLLSTVSISPTVMGPFAAGTITITTCGAGHTTDTDLWVFDAGLASVPTFGNDDQCPAPCVGPTFGSTLTRVFGAGTYYLALSNFNVATNQPAAVDDRFGGPNVLEFPDAVLNSSSATGHNLSFNVTDSSGTVGVTATKTDPYAIVWIRFTVAGTGPGVAMCVPGTAGVIGCLCGNPNGAGVGCANTGSSGAKLDSAGTASLAADATDPGSMTLTGSSMLSGSTCIFLQGDAELASGASFGAGIRCAGGTLERLYVKSIVAGARSAPEAGDRSISNRSMDLGDTIVAGTRRWYQTYYRDPALPNPGGLCPVITTFNVTSGQLVVWNP